jgi:biopolymer transport protein ExbB/TolQ
MSSLLYNSPAIACAELACQRAAARVHAQLKHHLRSLAFIAHSALFLGIFATVFGIAGSFRSISGSKSAALVDTPDDFPKP